MSMFASREKMDKTTHNESTILSILFQIQAWKAAQENLSTTTPAGILGRAFH